MQQILILWANGLRSDVEGWSYEDPSEVRKQFDKRIGTPNQYDTIHHMPIGLVGSGNFNYSKYKTVLHALGDGWRLLSAPIKVDDQYEYWLVKDCISPSF